MEERPPPHRLCSGGRTDHASSGGLAAEHGLQRVDRAEGLEARGAAEACTDTRERHDPSRGYTVAARVQIDASQRPLRVGVQKRDLGIPGLTERHVATVQAGLVLDDRGDIDPGHVVRQTGEVERHGLIRTLAKAEARLLVLVQDDGAVAADEPVEVHHGPTQRLTVLVEQTGDEVEVVVAAPLEASSRVRDTVEVVVLTAAKLVEAHEGLPSVSLLIGFQFNPFQKR